MSFYIKKGDRYPSISARLSTGKSITGGSVKFRMRKQGVSGAALKVDAAAVIVNGTTNDVRYDFAAIDTDEIGAFDAEWEITYADGKRETVPNDGFFTVRVSPRAS